MGFAGGIFGIFFGCGALRILSKLPQTASIVSAAFPPVLLLEALGVAVLAGLLAGAFPAWRGAHLSPVEALRHE
jgi:putative ABC transport system permease protein